MLNQCLLRHFSELIRKDTFHIENEIQRFLSPDLTNMAIYAKVWQYLKMNKHFAKTYQ